MSNRGIAYVLAIAIYTGNRGDTVDTEDTAEKIYAVINASKDFRGDEVKADVYAQLAEQLDGDTSFERAVNIIEAALDSTQRALGYGIDLSRTQGY